MPTSAPILMPSPNRDGTPTCSASDQASLIQSRVKVTLDTESTQASETPGQHALYGKTWKLMCSQS